MLHIKLDVTKEPYKSLKKPPFSAREYIMEILEYIEKNNATDINIEITQISKE